MTDAMLLLLHQFVFLRLLLCGSFFFNKGNGHLSFLTVTVSDALSIGTEAMSPGFSVALEEMTNRYPILFENHTSSYVSISPPGPDACSPAGAGEVTKRISQLYESEDFFRSINVILTPGKPDLCLLQRSGWLGI
jgi:hypothetical protein